MNHQQSLRPFILFGDNPLDLFIDHFQCAEVAVHSIPMRLMAVMNPKCYKSAISREWDSDTGKQQLSRLLARELLHRRCSRHYKNALWLPVHGIFCPVSRGEELGHYDPGNKPTHMSPNRNSTDIRPTEGCHALK